MPAMLKQFGVCLLLAACAAAQNRSAGVATVEDLQVVHEGNDVRVEIMLSNPVRPAVMTANNPERLILELPDTLSAARQRRILVNYLGVRSVRIGLNNAVPPITRLIVDLDQAHPYNLRSDGKRVLLTVSPALKQRQGAPVAGASGGLIGAFRRRQNAPAPGSPNDSVSTVLSPPPPGGPIALAGEQSGNDENLTSAAAPSRRTAANPNRASLQEGTVFPAIGAPGTGRVPTQAGTTSTVFGSASGSAASVPLAGRGAVSSQPKDEIVSAVKALPVGSAPGSIPSFPSAAVLAPAVVLVPPSQNPIPSAASPVLNAPAARDTVTTVPKEMASESSATLETEQPVVDLHGVDSTLRTVFKVKYVAEGVAYLDGGRSSGLNEGMKLEIKESDLPTRQGATADPADPRVTAELEVTAVAETSAVTEIHKPKRPVKTGDLAYLSSGDAQALVQQHALSATRAYPAVITFTEGDPLEEEAREEVPRPPLPSVNRARGRIGLDYLGTVSHGSSVMTSSDLGMVFRADFTRMGGSFWNLSGYWRGRLNASSSPGQPTLQDLINRTYHINLTYDNPNSQWVAGFGRLYLPWAPSLDTIDGGYFGARVAHGVTTGLFAGSTPDPTSWDYNPDQRIGGAFINFEGGSFDRLRYTSTSGLGVSTLKWQINRPFVFLENALFYKRYFSIYDSLQADSPRGNSVVPAPGAGLSRSFLTVRFQPHPRLELDFNHNYFRDVPTFDPTLIGTGLLDKYLFQGFSLGARLEVIKNIFVNTDLGRSNRTGDAKTSLNQAYGITFNHLPWFGLRSDAHYSKFDSSFGNGSYYSLSLSRNFTDNLRLDLLAGSQKFTSSLTTQTNSRFLTTNVESTLGAHYFIQGSFTIDRGQLSYDQWMFTLGYRFDSKSKRHE
jgi:hypothetical protein